MSKEIKINSTTGEEVTYVYVKHPQYTKKRCDEEYGDYEIICEDQRYILCFSPEEKRYRRDLSGWYLAENTSPLEGEEGVLLLTSYSCLKSMVAIDLLLDLNVDKEKILFISREWPEDTGRVVA